MTEIIRRHASLEIRSRLPAAIRGAFALAALVPLIAPWELLMKPAWNSFLHPAFILALVISAGAAAVSAVLLLAAVAGLNVSMTFDASKGTLTHERSAPLAPLRRSRYFFSRIRAVDLDREEGSDEEPSFALVVVMGDGGKVRSPSSPDRARMEDALSQARSLVQQGRGSSPPLR